MNAQLQIGRCVLVRQKNKRREYIRHGTQTLIASFDVVSGEIIQATVGETPTEADYLAHVKQTIAVDPHASKWHLIMDCLNTPKSRFWPSTSATKRTRDSD